MQGLSTVFAVLVCALAMLLGGHLLFSRGASGRVWVLVLLTVFALQIALLLVQLFGQIDVDPRWRAGLGACVPPLIFLLFARSGEAGAQPPQPYDMVHGLPAWLVLGLFNVPQAGYSIDLLIVLIEAGYALALLSLPRGAQPLRRRSLVAAAGFLLLMAVIDVLIVIELAEGRALASSYGLSLGVATVLAALLGLAVYAWRDPEWLAGLLGPWPATLRSEPAAPSAPDWETILCQRLDAHWRTHRGYREFGVSLSGTAAQLEVPARQLSAAINRVYGRGFRTLLNDWRVDDAARALRAPERARSITEVMFDAGFQTKSSFNKEFAQRMGMSPSDYREGATAP